METREAISKKVLLISAYSNAVLAIGKIIIGWFGNSDAVFADGIHSGTDVFTSVIALFIIKISNKPADEDHPYGHGKAEVISSGIVGILLILVSFYLGYEGLIGLIEPFQAPSILTLYVAILSFGIKQYLYRFSLKKAKQFKSKAIEAIALDHKADIAASFTAAIGVVLAHIGLTMNSSWLLYSDKVASIIVAVLILKMGVGILVESFNILLERNINGDVLADLNKIIAQFKEVKRVDKVRAREHGHYIMVDVRISIDHDKTIKEGHDLATEIKFTLMKKYTNIEEVLIHLNPYY
ncbi:cation diffusion facilitator family transporter [Bacillus sp. EB600]|uniref:cation diffusion facilitator family transporter n=1 Tax=Bacillus sp. EB600 TaxID=2806345 RepID=UPI00210AA338|nr:cation diffusion facilitator family transporter [Bacillus sp. EB600]MCQ6278851.1 cation transporter [Bacillus sp. EB600]